MPMKHHALTEKYKLTQVDEKLYDPDALRLVCIKRMYGLSINVRTDKKFDKQTGYKHTIYSTYSSLNDFTDSHFSGWFFLYFSENQTMTGTSICSLK